MGTLAAGVKRETRDQRVTVAKSWGSGRGAGGNDEEAGEVGGRKWLL